MGRKRVYDKIVIETLTERSGKKFYMIFHLKDGLGG